MYTVKTSIDGTPSNKVASNPNNNNGHMLVTRNKNKQVESLDGSTA